jgi:4'-phosphopantetheinyl transferase EntD
MLSISDESTSDAQRACTEMTTRALEIDADLEPIERSIRQLFTKLGGDVHFAAAVASPLEALHPVEEALAARMTMGRREAFVAGRVAIGRALRAAGHPGVAVGASPDGVPTLPDGYIGSIAHKHGRALAVVAGAAVAAGIGIDLEFDDALDDSDLRATVLVAAEVDQVATLAMAEPALASGVTLILAAKEAIYKAVFPVLRSPFDFDDVELTFVPEVRSFRAVRFPGSAQVAVEGHYSLAEHWMATVAIARNLPRSV